MPDPMEILGQARRDGTLPRGNLSAPQLQTLFGIKREEWARVVIDLKRMGLTRHNHPYDKILPAYDPGEFARLLRDYHKSGVPDGASATTTDRPIGRIYTPPKDYPSRSGKEILTEEFDGEVDLPEAEELPAAHGGRFERPKIKSKPKPKPDRPTPSVNAEWALLDHELLVTSGEAATMLKQKPSNASVWISQMVKDRGLVRRDKRGSAFLYRLGDIIAILEKRKRRAR